MESDYVPSVDFKLPKLKALVFEQAVINKGIAQLFLRTKNNVD